MISFSLSRKAHLLVPVFVFALLLPAFARAQDLKGSWFGWIESDDFLGAISLDITDRASSVTLYYAGDKRSGAIERLSLKGGEITFTAKLQPNAAFKGKLVAGRITGTLDILNRKTHNGGTWSVRRSPGPAVFAVKAPKRSGESGLPAPTGHRSIGRRLYFWTDQNRGEALTDDPTDHRRVFAQLWYPAKKGTGSKAEYIPAAVADKSQIPQGINIHAYSDATPAKGTFPLIVFSPGLGSDPLRYASIIEDLVSHGYVVAAMNHPYDSAPVLWPDGTRIETSKKWDAEVPKDGSADERKRFMDARRFEWARDASFVLDQVRHLDIGNSIDFEHVGMLGHSFGGQAASIVCASDVRFKSCVNMDGLAQGLAILPDADGKTMTQPFLFFTKVPFVTDTELAIMGITRKEYLRREENRLHEHWEPGFKKQISAIPSGGYLIVYPGVLHTTFSDGPLIDTNSPDPLATRLQRISNINKYVLAFFDQTLKGKRSDLLDSSNRQSGLMVEFLQK